MTQIRRCGQCGSRNIALESARGKFFPYKSFSRVKLGSDLNLPTCQDCGNVMFAEGDSARLDGALESTILASAQNYVENILKKTEWKQNEMADYIGFTPVYISEIKNGKRLPEARTLNYFKILSECPGALEMIVEDDPRCLLKPSYSMNIEHQIGVAGRNIYKKERPEEDLDFGDYGMVA